LLHKQLTAFAVSDVMLRGNASETVVVDHGFSLDVIGASHCRSLGRRSMTNDQIC
jgi:hypothetical protein